MNLYFFRKNKPLKLISYKESKNVRNYIYMLYFFRLYLISLTIYYFFLFSSQNHYYLYYKNYLFFIIIFRYFLKYFNYF